MDESKELELLHSNGQLGQSLVSPKRLLNQYFTSQKASLEDSLGVEPQPQLQRMSSSTRRGNRSSKGPYQEQSTLERSSEDDPDDPGEGSSMPSGPTREDYISALRPHVTYVVFKYKEEYFPGLVQMIMPNKIRIKHFTKGPLNTWIFKPKETPKDIPHDDIVDVLAIPTLSNTRNNSYFIPEMKTYGWP